MQIFIISAAALAALGAIAALASLFDKGDDTIVTPSHDCASCSAAADESCKLHCLMEEKKNHTTND